MELDKVKEKIQAGLPGAEVTILDPRRDSVHIKAVVTYKGFQGKTLVEQHQMVYATLKEELASDELHALGLETKET